jgi:hypothetical protein
MNIMCVYHRSEKGFGFTSVSVFTVCAAYLNFAVSLCSIALFFLSKYVHIGVQITFCVFSVNVGFLFLDATRSLFLVSLFVCDWTSLAE